MNVDQGQGQRCCYQTENDKFVVDDDDDSVSGGAMLAIAVLRVIIGDNGILWLPTADSLMTLSYSASILSTSSV